MLDDSATQVDEANLNAAQAMVSAEPVWTDIRPAIDAIPDMREDLVLHSGPPIPWDRMLDAQKGAVICAAQYEGLADSPEEAEEQFAAGEIDLAPAHDHQATGPGSGAISANMPVFVVEDRVSGNEGYCTIAELLMVFGCYEDDAVASIEHLRDTIGPVLKEAVDRADGIPVKPLLAKSLLMGDEGHDRTTAGSNLLSVQIAPDLVNSDIDQEKLAQFFEYIPQTELFFFTFLNMAASKAVTRAAEDITHSSVVTVMAGNGIEYGIKVSGLGDEWFTGPAPILKGSFFGEYTQADAAPEQGDSIVTETAGLGGFSLPASPAHIDACGETMERAQEEAKRMQEITVLENLTLDVPNTDSDGAPTGVDIRSVVETGITPFHAAGLGHKDRGEGFIGLGTGRAPKVPFTKAAQAFKSKYEI
ncbi:DUF1116 domain-containing protein [Halobellus ordinarius]|uniref:DUF1116 domain-containing protein n=1 Tax=Halobellus ordinarius TaxID=3075120 RepID=UPI00288074B8|nr:DUF1116 domain-containing protein [Halobellus sp. ZY16]